MLQLYRDFILLCMSQVVSLSKELLEALPSDFAAAATLVFGSIETALLASKELQNQVVAMDDPPDEALVGPVLVVAPTSDQVQA